MTQLKEQERKAAEALKRRKPRSKFGRLTRKRISWAGYRRARKNKQLIKLCRSTPAISNLLCVYRLLRRVLGRSRFSLESPMHRGVTRRAKLVRKNKPVKVGIYKKRIKKLCIPYFWLSSTLLIRDLEHYMGTSVYLILNCIGTMGESPYFYILRYCFFIQFRWVEDFFLAPLHEAYVVLYYGGLYHDLDIICKFYQEVLEESYYADAPKLFKAFANFLAYLWPIYIRFGAGVGLFFELKGKFHRYMTIESVSKRLRLGSTTHSTVNYGLAFRYRQGVNETGAFGIHIHLLTSNEIKSFYKDNF